MVGHLSCWSVVSFSFFSFPCVFLCYLSLLSFLFSFSLSLIVSLFLSFFASHLLFLYFIIYFLFLLSSFLSLLCLLLSVSSRGSLSFFCVLWVFFCDLHFFLSKLCSRFFHIYSFFYLSVSFRCFPLSYLQLFFPSFLAST